MNASNNNSNTPQQNFPDEPVIGIDLGTTNSLVAWCSEAGPVIIPDAQGRAIVPSVVRFSDDGKQVAAVGHDARDHAIEYPQQTIFSIKRLMGRGMADVADELKYLACEVVQGPNDTARVKVADRVFSPQEISAIILDKLRQQAEAYFGKPVHKAVITVPAYFDDAQRQATRDAGRIAGLKVLRIVNEPTAAALAYNLGLRATAKKDAHKDAKKSAAQDDTVAVFDLGGGTFDVSILRLQHTGEEGEDGQPATGPVSQVLATAGDTHLGGDDVDQMIMDLLFKDIRAAFGQDVQLPPASLQALRLMAETTKIRLSQQEMAHVELDLGNGKVSRQTITRDQLESMMSPWADRALDCCKKAMAAAGLSASDISRVIMVGGSTRIPLVRQRVGDFFKTEPYLALDPDQVVALGASVQGSILAGVNRDMLLLDVIPLSLGIETMGGAVAKLIVANATIPARAVEKFSTYVDGQTNVKIHVLQGERELAADCRTLGEFDLRGIPPMPAGFPKIEVTFLVDANGILNVSAVERRSEKYASIQIIPNHGLTREEVSRIEHDSLVHARADMAAHQLIDLRNQARLDMRAIDRQMTKAGEDLTPEVRKDIDAKVAAVQVFLDTKEPDLKAFQAALTKMDHVSVPLAEAAISRTLREEDE